MANKQQLLRVGGQTEVGRRFALRETVDPVHEILHARARGNGQAAVVSLGVSRLRVSAAFGAFGQLVVVFEGGWGEDGVDKVCELLEIGFVVDLAAVGLGDKDADEVPWQL